MTSENYKRLASAVTAVSLRNIPSLSLFRAQEKEGLYKLGANGHPRLSGT